MKACPLTNSDSQRLSIIRTYCVNEDEFEINKVPDHVSVPDTNNDDDVPNVTVKPDDELLVIQ